MKIAFLKKVKITCLEKQNSIILPPPSLLWFTYRVNWEKRWQGEEYILAFNQDKEGVLGHLLGLPFLTFSLYILKYWPKSCSCRCKIKLHPFKFWGHFPATGSQIIWLPRQLHSSYYHCCTMCFTATKGGIACCVRTATLCKRILPNRYFPSPLL